MGLSNPPRPTMLATEPLSFCSRSAIDLTTQNDYVLLVVQNVIQNIGYHALPPLLIPRTKISPLIFSLFVGCFYHKGPALTQIYQYSSLNNDAFIFKKHPYLHKSLKVFLFVKKIALINCMFIVFTRKWAYILYNFLKRYVYTDIWYFSENTFWVKGY